MSSTVFILVIAAALLHAVWNALIKGSKDQRLNMTALALGGVPISLIVLFLQPFPNQESWGYILLSTLIHLIYLFTLLGSYKTGELSQVYPIARGSAPLIVAAVSFFILKESFNFSQIAAIILIIFGVLISTFAKQSTGRRNFSAAKLALFTGCMIAAYSIVDGFGGRVSGSALSYFACVAICYGVIFPLIVERQTPGLIKRIPKEAKLTFFVGSNASFIAYAIVVWAFTQAPIALVTALRETSISFALIIGVLFLKEQNNVFKVLAVVLTLAGAIVLKLVS